MTRSEVEIEGSQGATNSAEARCLDNFILLVDPEEPSLGKNLARDGYWEAWVTSYFTKVVKPGDVVCDVGANYGYFTRLFESLAGRDGLVYSVEANPALSALLAEAIEKYPIVDAARVEILNMAAMDQRGEIDLNVSSELGGASIIHVRPASRPIKVEAWPLDLVIENSVDVIKMDIEGAEPFALSGMARLVKNSRICVIESGNYHPEEFMKMLFSKFEVGIIDLTGNERSYSLHQLRSEDNPVMLILKPKKAGSVILVLRSNIKTMYLLGLVGIARILGKLAAKLIKNSTP